jgi:hypothetical protein
MISIKHIKNSIFRSAVCLICLLLSCSVENHDKDKDTNEQDLIVGNKEGKSIIQAERERTIFYTLPTPLEMSEILETSSSSFQPDLLTPIDDIDKYFTISNQSMVIGMFGVDIGYIKLFEQNQYLLNYLAATNNLATKIGIPTEQINKAVELFEKNEEQKQVIVKLLDNLFDQANKYLTSNNRESAANLILLGGWVEALYLACNLQKQEWNNKTLVNKIAEQKFTLNILLELLEPNKKNEDISGFIDQLVTLQDTYKNVDIEKLKEMQDSNTTILKGDGQRMAYLTEEQLDDICDMVSYMRTKIIE